MILKNCVVFKTRNVEAVCIEMSLFMWSNYDLTSTKLLTKQTLFLECMSKPKMFPKLEELSIILFFKRECCRKKSLMRCFRFYFKC